MKQTINIEGKPFTFEAENLTVETDPIITFDQAKAVLEEAKMRLDEKGIGFGLVYGTLLGAIREHSFIAHDYDVDVYVWDEEALLRAIPEFFEQGFKICRVVPNRLYSFRHDGAYIDLYIKRKAPFPFCLYCYWVGSHIVPKRFFDKTKEIDFLGKKYLVPEDAEGYLKFTYGKTWRTPIKGYTGRNSIYPVYLWRKLRKKLKF